MPKQLKQKTKSARTREGDVKKRRGARLDSASDLKRFLGKQINACARGEITTDQLRATSYAIQIMLAILEASDFQTGLQELKETILKQRQPQQAQLRH